MTVGKKSIAVNEAPPSALVRLAKTFIEATVIVDDLDEKLKIAKSRRLTAEKKLADEMVTHQIALFKTPLGRFRTEPVCYPNVVDRDALEEYANSRKDLKFLLTKSVHGGKLRSYVTECLEQGKEIPPGIDPYTQIVVRHTKA